MKTRATCVARAFTRAPTQPPLEDDSGVEADGGVAAVEEAGGAPAVDAGIPADEEDIGAVAAGAGAVAAGAAMVEDAAGFSLFSLLPPQAASPTTNADATTIRVSFMGSLRAVGCQLLAQSLNRECREPATPSRFRSGGRNVL